MTCRNYSVKYFCQLCPAVSFTEMYKGCRITETESPHSSSAPFTDFIWSEQNNLITGILQQESHLHLSTHPWILTEQLDCDWSDVNRIRKHLITSHPDTWRSNRTNLHFGRDAVWDLVALLSGRGVRLGQQTRVRHGAVLRLHELVRKQRVRSPVSTAWGILTDKCWIWKCFSLEEFQQTLLTPC